MIDRQVIPLDRSTLFVCSGMQQHKGRFREPDGTQHGTLQSCIRTNDLELVGDGSHLTHFHMLGNFSFGRSDYEQSVELWDGILRELEVPVTHVTCHPSRSDMRTLWTRRGYTVVPDDDCEWSDGEIGGYCCEVFAGELELGNLVNPQGHSVDVGFGWERLIQVIEGCEHVQQTSLFRQDLDPVVSDHLRCLGVMRENGVSPGPKGRDYVCRRLVQRVLDRVKSPELLPEHVDWLSGELEGRERRLKQGRRVWRRFRGRPLSFWRETFGLTPQEVERLRDE